MTANAIFSIDTLVAYVAWSLCVATYLWPRLRAMDRDEAIRAIATLHSFRFFGLVFLLPGFVGPGLPVAFAAPAAYGDLIAALLAIAVLLALRIGARAAVLPLAWIFNAVGAADILLATAHGVGVNLPAIAGELGGAYAILMLYVPLLLVTHGIAIYLLVRPYRQPAHSAA